MKPQHFRHKKHSFQAGNAMLFILIGIVLFSALTFVFARGSRSPSGISSEDARLYAQEILSYAEKINGAVQTIMLQNGCSGTRVSFENTSVAGYNHVPPSPQKCNVFNSTVGGGMSFESPPSGALTVAGDYLFTGNVCIDGVGTGPYATCESDSLKNEELLLILPSVNAEVCVALNRLLSNSATIPQEATGGYNSTKFTGTYADGFALGSGAPAKCFQSTGGSPGSGYHFHYTLLEH
ncbi:MAG: hypothetical protein KAI61_07130 [Alphaproteobacteria bacterium]|nr:hypothetical protein [Alphaproteobacteria bacterium]